MITPRPGEVAVWGTLQGGRAPTSTPHLSRAERLRGAMLSLLSAASTGFAQWRESGEVRIRDLVFPVLVAVVVYAVFSVVVRVSRARPGYREPVTAWFLSRERLVVSSANGTGLEIAVADIRRVSPTFAEGAPAIDLEVGDLEVGNLGVGDLEDGGLRGRTLRVLAADRAGLLAALRSLRPDLAA